MKLWFLEVFTATEVNLGKTSDFDDYASLNSRLFPIELHSFEKNHDIIRISR